MMAGKARLFGDADAERRAVAWRGLNLLGFAPMGARSRLSAAARVE
jgi:hypothetical protein